MSSDYWKAEGMCRMLIPVECCDRVPGHGGITQNETADGIARKGARTKPIGPEPYLLLFLRRYKSQLQS